MNINLNVILIEKTGILVQNWESFLEGVAKMNFSNFSLENQYESLTKCELFSNANLSKQKFEANKLYVLILP